MAKDDASEAMDDLRRLADPAVLETLSREELYATVQAFLRVIERQQVNLDRLSASIQKYVSERDREKRARVLADTKHKGTA